MRTAPLNVEHLVVGGGPAGAMAALRLAAAGRDVLLAEKETGAHDKVCGEFLSREAVDYLHQAGISPLQLGAQAIHRVRLSKGAGAAESLLPFQALSLSRRVLDAALLARAEQKGCRILRGTAAESLTKQGEHWLASLNSGAIILANNVFLATGKHDLRGHLRPFGKQSDLVGFKLHWRLAPTQVEVLRGCMDLYLFPEGYGGLSLIEDDVANLCLVVRQSTFRAIGGWPQLLDAILSGNRHLRQILDGATGLWPRPIAISPIPYGYLARESDGLWRIGDQAAVIPSFTGDGISIALHSAALATQMFLAGASAASYQRALYAQLSWSMTLATLLSRAAVTQFGRALAPAALTFLPGAMRWIAAATRIPESSLVQQGLENRPDGLAAQQRA